uniref:Prefoldin subunit 5 n=1 Tax=Romanomermis culicivorax TaxID=13658 RepID=A0A915ITH2_ROMCU
MNGTQIASAKGETETPNNAQVINVNQLSMEEIHNLQEQMDNELEFFGESYQQLREVQQKLHSSSEAVVKMCLNKAGQDVLIPLTSSMYVPGALSDVSNVLIDIGTGYHVQMSMNDAKDFFSRKLENLSQQMEKIQNILMEKQKIKRYLIEILQTKVQEALHLQQQQKANSPMTSGTASKSDID